MNGTDTISMISMSLTNGNHTGSNNNLYGVRLQGLSGGGADAEATEVGLQIGSSTDAANWDRAIMFTGSGLLGTRDHFFNENTDGTFVFNTDDADPSYVFGAASTAQVVFQGSKEVTTLMGTDLSLSGTTLTIDPNANVVEVFGDGSDTVSIITIPTTASHTERVTFICQDADVTFLDGDAAGAAGTINLAGTATNFTCSADDTLTLAYYVAPVSGNARWVEVARSIN
jgi:hypothetical protein